LRDNLRNQRRGIFFRLNFIKEPKEGNIFPAKFYGKAGTKYNLTSEKEVNTVLQQLNGKNYKILEVQYQERRRNPSPPFTTSTLQQEAYRKLGFSTKKTMITAQQLYEGIEVGKKGEPVGLITYMRTDATFISPLAREEAAKYIGSVFGEAYLPEKPKCFWRGIPAGETEGFYLQKRSPGGS